MKIKTRAWVRRIILLLVLLWGSLTAISLQIGFVFIFLGLLWHIWAIGCLVRNTSLTTWGPYRFVRHPFYFGNMLIDIGICVAGGNYYIGAVYIVLFYFAYYRRMLAEEQHLTGLFPNDYPEYIKRVPRFIPLWFQRFPVASEGFKWHRLVTSGNEFARVIRLLLHPLILYLQFRRFPNGLITLRSNRTIRPDDMVPGIIGIEEICIIAVIILFSIIAHFVHRSKPVEE